MPKKLTAATALDALADAVESYVTPLANEFTEALSLKAVSLIFKWLPVAYREPDNMTARQKVHVAITLADMAFSNSGLGIAHSIAYAIGGLFNIEIEPYLNRHEGLVIAGFPILISSVLDAKTPPIKPL